MGIGPALNIAVKLFQCFAIGLRRGSAYQNTDVVDERRCKVALASAYISEVGIVEEVEYWGYG